MDLCTQQLPDDSDESMTENSINRKQVGIITVEENSKLGIKHHEYPIFEGDNIIGRHENCDISIPMGLALSKKHACIEAEGDSIYIFDFGSCNKTRLGKMKLKPDIRYNLQDKDNVTFANITCKFKRVEAIANKNISSDQIHTHSPDEISPPKVSPAAKMLALDTPESLLDQCQSNLNQIDCDVIPESQPCCNTSYLSNKSLSNKGDLSLYFDETSESFSEDGRGPNKLKPRKLTILSDSESSDAEDRTEVEKVLNCNEAFEIPNSDDHYDSETDVEDNITAVGENIPVFTEQRDDDLDRLGKSLDESATNEESFTESETLPNFVQHVPEVEQSPGEESFSAMETLDAAVSANFNRNHNNQADLRMKEHADATKRQECDGSGSDDDGNQLLEEMETQDFVSTYSPMLQESVVQEKCKKSIKRAINLHVHETTLVTGISDVDDTDDTLPVTNPCFKNALQPQWNQVQTASAEKIATEDFEGGSPKNKSHTSKKFESSESRVNIKEATFVTGISDLDDSSDLSLYDTVPVENDGAENTNQTSCLTHNSQPDQNASAGADKTLQEADKLENPFIVSAHVKVGNTSTLCTTETLEDKNTSAPVLDTDSTHFRASVCPKINRATLDDHDASNHDVPTFIHTTPNASEVMTSAKIESSCKDGADDSPSRMLDRQHAGGKDSINGVEDLGLILACKGTLESTSKYISVSREHANLEKDLGIDDNVFAKVKTDAEESTTDPRNNNPSPTSSSTCKLNGENMKIDEDGDDISDDAKSDEVSHAMIRKKVDENSCQDDEFNMKALESLETQDTTSYYIDVTEEAASGEIPLHSTSPEKEESCRNNNSLTSDSKAGCSVVSQSKRLSSNPSDDKVQVTENDNILDDFALKESLVDAHFKSSHDSITEEEKVLKDGDVSKKKSIGNMMKKLSSLNAGVNYSGSKSSAFDPEMLVSDQDDKFNLALNSTMNCAFSHNITDDLKNCTKLGFGSSTPAKSTEHCQTSEDFVRTLASGNDAHRTSSDSHKNTPRRDSSPASNTREPNSNHEDVSTIDRIDASPESNNKISDEDISVTGRKCSYDPNLSDDFTENALEESESQHPRCIPSLSQYNIVLSDSDLSEPEDSELKIDVSNLTNDSLDDVYACAQTQVCREYDGAVNGNCSNVNKDHASEIPDIDLTPSKTDTAPTTRTRSENREKEEQISITSRSQRVGRGKNKKRDFDMCEWSRAVKKRKITKRVSKTECSVDDTAPNTGFNVTELVPAVTEESQHKSDDISNQSTSGVAESSSTNVNADGIPADKAVAPARPKRGKRKTNCSVVDKLPRNESQDITVNPGLAVTSQTKRKMSTRLTGKRATTNTDVIEHQANAVNNLADNASPGGDDTDGVEFSALSKRPKTRSVTSREVVKPMVPKESNNISGDNVDVTTKKYVKKTRIKKQQIKTESQRSPERTLTRRSERKRKTCSTYSQEESTTELPAQAAKEEILHTAALALRPRRIKPKVMFTGLIDKVGEKIVKELGGHLTDDMQECTHLVTDKIRRTIKFLCAVVRGIYIINPKWLQDSKKHSRFLPEEDYESLQDSANNSSSCSSPNTSVEEQYGFNLFETLATSRTRSHLLFKGLRIHVKLSVLPPPEAMYQIIECGGGIPVRKMPRGKELADLIIVATPRDKRSCASAMKAGIPVVGSEYILTGILQQNLQLEAYRLFHDAAE